MISIVRRKFHICSLKHYRTVNSITSLALLFGEFQSEQLSIPSQNEAVKGTPADMDGGSSYTFRAAGKMPLGSSDKPGLLCNFPRVLREAERKQGAGNEIFSYIRFFYSRYSLRTISIRLKSLLKAKY
jgi:hypothetical protein